MSNPSVVSVELRMIHPGGRNYDLPEGHPWGMTEPVTEAVVVLRWAGVDQPAMVKNFIRMANIK